MDKQIAFAALDSSARGWFGVGLGAAFLLSLAAIVIFMRMSDVDHGFLGLIFLLTIIVFLIAFSFLVAASVAGADIKIAVAVTDALVLIGSKLLTPRFLKYLES